MHGAVEGDLRNFSMAKKTRGGARGPYKTETEDPDQLGTGGIRLRQHRLFRNMTVESLAAGARVSTGTISGIEGGDLGYSHIMLAKLAKALETTIGALFDVDPRKDGGEVIWPLWNRASEKERQRIADHAKGVVGPKGSSNREGRS